MDNCIVVVVYCFQNYDINQVSVISTQNIVSQNIKCPPFKV